MKQTQDYKEGKLTKEQIKKLKAIKFPFDYYIKNKEVDNMNNRKLWDFLEKWTRPDNEDAFPQWKQELDSVFYDDTL